jgi:hypothetical protein
MRPSCNVWVPSSGARASPACHIRNRRAFLSPSQAVFSLKDKCRPGFAPPPLATPSDPARISRTSTLHTNYFSLHISSHTVQTIEVQFFSIRIGYCVYSYSCVFPILPVILPAITFVAIFSFPIAIGRDAWKLWEPNTMPYRLRVVSQYRCLTTHTTYVLYYLDGR